MFHPCDCADMNHFWLLCGNYALKAATCQSTLNREKLTKSLSNYRIWNKKIRAAGWRGCLSEQSFPKTRLIFFKEKQSKLVGYIWIAI